MFNSCPCPAASFLLKLVALGEGVIAFCVEDDVVEEAEAQDFCGFFELVCDVAVFGAGFQLSVGVVVGNDDGGGSFGYDVGEDFPRVNVAFVDQADADDPDVHYLVCAVDGNAQKVLLFSVGVVLDEGKHVGRKLDLQAFGLDPSSNEFKGRSDGGGNKPRKSIRSWKGTVIPTNVQIH